MVDIAQGLANAVYRGAARLSGRILGSSEVVQSVFAHRSVASGEVSFGQSDIDLLMVVRQPNPESWDGPELAALYGKVRLLRCFNPAVGHIEVHDPPGLRSWIETDTYRGSLERRIAVLLHGKPIDLPDVPVRKEDAARRFALWPDSFFSTAVREGNRRNLRKIAARMWNAYAVASGLIQEPFLTRKETEAHWSAAGDGALLREVVRNPESAPGCVFKLAKRLHDRLLPALEPLPETLVFRMRMPPRFRRHVFVVLPEAGSPVPAAVSEPRSFLSTPESLHLYIHYVNPFLDWILPPELRRLGFLQPTPRELVRACQFYGHSHTLRNPGFMHQNTWTPATGVAVIRHTLRYLRDRELPPALAPQEVEALIANQPSCQEYYHSVFPGVYRESREQWEILRRMEAEVNL